MGREVLPVEKDYILQILSDVLHHFKQGSSFILSLGSSFSREDVSYDEFFQILEPFFTTCFENLSQNITQVEFRHIC